MIDLELQLAQGAFQLAAQLRSDARVLGLFGPSGAGKSTLLNALVGSLPAVRGKVVIDGRCLLDSVRGICVPVHARGLGVVYQEGRLFPHLSVRNNLTYGARWLKPGQQRFDLRHVVDLLEIGPLLDNRPHQLSGGERQRVALARALLASPQMLLLDEPLAALDARLKSQILPFLRRVKEEIAIPMIYVSHSIREIQELTDEVAVIEDGRVLACGPYREVMTGMAGSGLSQALGVDNLVPLVITQSNPASGQAVAMVGEHPLVLPYPELQPGQQVTAVIPAAAIALARTVLSGVTIQNQLPGRITQVRLVGHRALVTVDAGTPLVVEVTEKAVQDLQLTLGQPVVCLVKAQSISLLGHG